MKTSWPPVSTGFSKVKEVLSNLVSRQGVFPLTQSTFLQPEVSAVEEAVI